MSITSFLSSFSVPTILLIAIIPVCYFIFQALFLHPLRQIPSAHWSIPIFGDTWILYQRWKCRNNTVTYAAHLQYGEVVRMGRNELSINCVDNGIRTIYGGSWEKHPWYPRQFAMYGIRNMFSTINHSAHSQKKRTMANIYSKSYIASSPQVAANSKTLLSTRYLPLLQSTNGEAIDVHSMNNAFAIDFMSAYQFGLKSSTNFTQQVDVRNKILETYHLSAGYEVYFSEIPWLIELCNKIGFPLLPKSLEKVDQILGDWNTNMCKSAENYVSGIEKDDYIGNQPIVYQQFKTGVTKLRTKDQNAGKEIDPSLNLQEVDYDSLEVQSEMMDHLLAGHETSAVALTYLQYELSKHPDLQNQLRKELHSLEPKISWPLPTGIEALALPEPKQIDELPILNAILMETLRLHSPIPGMEPRVTPYTPGGNTLGKYSKIPGGIRVSSMPYTLHRNSEVFSDPLSFNPSRWMIKDEEKLREMNRWFWAFGSGGRMCIGSNLAIQEIKLLIAAIYSNWKSEIFNDDGIEEIDAWTTRPKSNQLYLKFHHI